VRTTLAPNGRGDDQGLVSLALFAQANMEDLTADQGARLEIDVGVSGNLLLIRCEASAEASGFPDRMRTSSLPSFAVEEGCDHKKPPYTL